MAFDPAPTHRDTNIDVAEAEQFGALAGNWLEARKDGDSPAAEAFEDELHERITLERIANTPGFDTTIGGHSFPEAENLRNLLEQMWNNASVRLD